MIFPVFSPVLLFAILHATTAAAATHLVSQGDTLNTIARQNHCTVVMLKAANGLTTDLIRVGQTLKLPETAVAVPLPKPPPPLVPVVANEAVEAALKKLSAADRWKVQLFLDHALFAPGKVDGITGEFTIKAASRWIAAGKDRDMGALLLVARARCDQTQTAFTIPATALNFVGVMPATLEEKAAAKKLLYETLAEYTAERFHTDCSTLSRLNPGVDLAGLKEGDNLQVPAVTPFVIELWPSAGLAAVKASADVQLCINHEERVIEVLRNDGSLCAAFPITVGALPEDRRSGVWCIRSIAPNPSFNWDDTMLKEGRKGAVQHLLPSGPNNPVGVLWLEIEPVNGPEAHIGIHGTNDPARIGRGHSSGCIRLGNWDIVRLSKLVGKGTLITWSASASQPTLAVSGLH